MRKNFTTVGIVLCFFLVGARFDALYGQQFLSATGSTYRVFFRDKGTALFERGSALYTKTEALFTVRALERRRKVLPPENLLTIADAPLYAPYLDSIRRTGATLGNGLRWRNYTLVTCSTVQLEQIRRFSFVRAVQPCTARLFPQEFSHTAEMLQGKTMSAADAAAQALEHISLHNSNCGTLHYGDSQRQLQSINIPPVHELGVTGKGVLVGVMDVGFRWRAQNSLKGASVLAEYDFIQNDTNAANEQKAYAADLPDQDEHGTKVMSIMAGYAPQKLIGAAFGASYLLAKTEDLRYERHIEEDNAAAALEWLEAQGADIVNASLGYSYFDQPDESYPYSELDGKTTILSRAVNDAAARGLFCVTSAGNDGRRGSQTLNAPADADSAFAVAALRADSAGAAVFSSQGPRADGALKPDIAAQGDTVLTASPTGNEYQFGRGTSFASPLIAGGAALLLSAFPELKPYELRSLLTSTASKANAPNTILGYGIANVLAAMRRAGTIVAPEIVSYPMLGVQRVGISALPRGISLRATLYVRFAGEQNYTPLELRPFLPSTLYLADIPMTRFAERAAELYAEVDDGVQTRRIPASGTMMLRPRVSSVPCGILPSSLPISKPNDVREGIVPSPVSSDAGTATLLLTTSEVGNLDYTIYSTYGSPILSDTVQVTSGISTIPIRVSTLARGVYFVHVRYNGTVQMFRFVVN